MYTPLSHIYPIYFNHFFSFLLVLRYIPNSKKLWCILNLAFFNGKFYLVYKQHLVRIEIGLSLHGSFFCLLLSSISTNTGASAVLIALVAVAVLLNFLEPTREEFILLFSTLFSSLSFTLSSGRQLQK